jgi:2-phosphosulfolactate phosphatase
MTTPADAFDQHGFDIRLGWGIDGLKALRPAAAAVVVVDVLSFSTCVDVATARGATVLPYYGPAEAVEGYARRYAAVAAGRRGGTGIPWSISPSSLTSIPRNTRLVLPSPNGSRLSTEAAGAGIVTVGCLRNASSVGGALRDGPFPIAVIAAGERWGHAEGALRPAVEDLIGAGAIVAALGLPSCSPEARAAQAVFEAARPSLGEYLRNSASGRELIEQGFEADVEIASQDDRSDTVPVLLDGAFVDRRRR